MRRQQREKTLSEIFALPEAGKVGEFESLERKVANTERHLSARADFKRAARSGDVEADPDAFSLGTQSLIHKLAGQAVRLGDVASDLYLTARDEGTRARAAREVDAMIGVLFDENGPQERLRKAQQVLHLSTFGGREVEGEGGKKDFEFGTSRHHRVSFSIVQFFSDIELIDPSRKGEPQSNLLTRRGEALLTRLNERLGAPEQERPKGDAVRPKRVLKNQMN